MNKRISSLMEVDGLTLDFGPGTSAALSDVSFTLNRNEVLGIVGETGAGKSVLGRALINLLPGRARIISGDVRLEGNSVFAMDPADLRRMRGARVALIGTNPKALLDPVRQVGKQVADVLLAHKKCSKVDALAAAVDLFAKVGISDPRQRSKSYPHQLSGGMAQRIVIAMATIAEPEVIVADDATLGLDATIQIQVLDLLVSRCRALNSGIVLITHDLGIIARYCDRVAIMHSGRIVELDQVRAFLAEPRHPEGAALLEAAKARPTPVLAQARAVGNDVGRSDTPLLQVKHLEKTFPISRSRDVVRAVDDVSFSINRRQTLALVGESGSGKTTIGQCLVRLIPADRGQIVFDGEDISTMREGEFRQLRRRIQMVFQEPYVALNPRWCVEDLVGEPLAMLGMAGGAERLARVNELLGLVHLPTAAGRRFPHQLTAGEQKRVGIARALATSPDFVVFDEPTTALDIRVRAQIIDLVRELQAQMGLSALFITHDLNSVRSLAHFVAVMHSGKIVERGETETIFSNPAEAYTKSLLSAELPVQPAGHSNLNRGYRARRDVGPGSQELEETL